MIHSIFINNIKKEIIKGKFINQKLNGFCSIIFNDYYQILGNFDNDILLIDKESILVDLKNDQNYNIIFYSK